MKYQYRTW